MAYTIELTDKQAEADSTYIWNQLFHYNLQSAEPVHHTLLRVFARNEKGELIGGLLGETFWRWLHIEVLWVHEDYRRAGLGKELMSHAESEGVSRGCLHAYVDTMDFQAPDFYPKLGYSIWGILENFPPRHQRIFFKKDITG